jgi:hypothetical protein
MPAAAATVQNVPLRRIRNARILAQLSRSDNGRVGSGRNHRAPCCRRFHPPDPPRRAGPTVRRGGQAVCRNAIRGVNHHNRGCPRRSRRVGRCRGAPAPPHRAQQGRAIGDPRQRRCRALHRAERSASMSGQDAPPRLPASNGRDGVGANGGWRGRGRRRDAVDALPASSRACRTMLNSADPKFGDLRAKYRVQMRRAQIVEPGTRQARRVSTFGFHRHTVRMSHN